MNDIRNRKYRVVQLRGFIWGIKNININNFRLTI